MTDYVSPVNQYLKSIDIQPYERYLPNSFNDSLTMLEKVNKVIYQLNDNNELTNEMVEKWNDFTKLVNEGGLIDVKIGEALEDESLIKLIDEKLIVDFKKDIIQETDNKLNGVNLKLDGNSYLITGLIENQDITSILNEVLSLNVLRSRNFKIPKGKYLITKDIEVKSNTVLSGDGIGNTILQIKNLSSDSKMATHGIIMTENNGSNITIKDLTVDGNMQNQNWDIVGSANYGISVRSNNTVIHNVECKNVTGNGCGVPISAKNVVFSSIFSHDNGKKGFHSGMVENIQIINGYFYNNKLDCGIGIHQGMKLATISNNHCFGNGTYGIIIGDSIGSPSHELIIIGNICYDNVISDIFVSGMGDTVELLEKNAIITSNILKGKGITISSSKNVELINNILVNANVLIQTSFSIQIRANNIKPVNNKPGIKVEGVSLNSTSLKRGSKIKIENNEIDCTNLTIPNAIEVSGHENVKIMDNDVIGVTTNSQVRLWDSYHTSFIKHIGSVRIENDTYSNYFNSYDVTTICEQSNRPKKPKTGEKAFDTTLGKPIWCKTQPTYDSNGVIITPPIWVDATGVVV